MDDDQQFCLRWNNHQSTLVSVFDNLLENGTLVDCTLFAEGKYLKAHKVVLSACSPYFEALLTQQYDKHPIFILKDVKFQELKAMMDYMYRGEVNISQDQLAALLKAAESLQIKGLSDSRSKESEQRKSAPPPPAKTPPPAPTPTLPRVQGLTIEQRKAPKLADTTIEDSRSREGSTSPVPRKRKKPRRRPSQEGVNDNHDASSSSESHSNQAPISNIPSLPAVPLASTSKLTVTDVPEPVEAKSEIVTRQKAAVVESPQVPIKEKLETHSELILEPKSEYIEEEMNEDSVEDLTLDDDDVSQMEQEMDHARPGPSHGSTDGSAQGFGGWHMSGNQNQDEVFLAAQEAVGAHRDSQESENIGGKCEKKRHREEMTLADKESVKRAKKLRKNLQPFTTAHNIRRLQKLQCKLNVARNECRKESKKSSETSSCSSPEKENDFPSPLAQSTVVDFQLNSPTKILLGNEIAPGIRKIVIRTETQHQMEKTQTENKESTQEQSPEEEEEIVSNVPKFIVSKKAREKMISPRDREHNNSGADCMLPREEDETAIVIQNITVIDNALSSQEATDEESEHTSQEQAEQNESSLLLETTTIEASGNPEEGENEATSSKEEAEKPRSAEQKKTNKQKKQSPEAVSGQKPKPAPKRRGRKKKSLTEKKPEERIPQPLCTSTIRTRGVSKKLIEKSLYEEFLKETYPGREEANQTLEEENNEDILQGCETFLICPFCEKLFNKMSNYDFHLKNVHADNN